MMQPRGSSTLVEEPCRRGDTALRASNALHPTGANGHGRMDAGNVVYVHSGVSLS